MSYGTAFVSPLPSPGITPGPDWATQLNAWATEAEGKLEGKITPTDIDISSVGALKHGDLPIPIPASAMQVGIGTFTAPSATAQYWVSGSGTDRLSIPLFVPVGCRLKSVIVWGRNGGTAWSIDLRKTIASTGVGSSLGTAASGSVAGTDENRAIGPITETVVSGASYAIAWLAGAGGARVYHAEVTYDRVV